MERFEIEDDPRHLVADIHGCRALIDTGSPASFGRSGVTLCGESRSVPDQWAGRDVDELSEYVGGRLDVLLGWDILRDARLDFDMQRLELRCCGDEPTGGRVVSLEAVRGLPRVRCELDGHALRLFLDTGSTITYLPEKLAAAGPPVDDFDDFYPGKGRFPVERRRARLEIAGETFDVLAGSPPPIVTELLGSDADGILGLDVLRRQRFLIDGPASRLVLGPEHPLTIRDQSVIS
jgi:hypothetical protein